MSDDNAVRERIEKTIVQAREDISGRLDELDERLREEFDLGKLASEHAIQLMGAGAAIGFVLGVGVPRAILRTFQIGIPIALAIGVAKRVHELQEQDGPEGEGPTETNEFVRQ